MNFNSRIAKLESQFRCHDPAQDAHAARCCEIVAADPTAAGLWDRLRERGFATLRDVQKNSEALRIFNQLMRHVAAVNSERIVNCD